MEDLHAENRRRSQNTSQFLGIEVAKYDMIPYEYWTFQVYICRCFSLLIIIFVALEVAFLFLFPTLDFLLSTYARACLLSIWCSGAQRHTAWVCDWSLACACWITRCRFRQPRRPSRNSTTGETLMLLVSLAKSWKKTNNSFNSQINFY